MPRTSILIVEDDPIAARNFAYSVGAVNALELLATVHNVAGAKRFLQARPVDVCLVDLGLPDGSGLEVIRFAAAMSPAPHILVCSVFGDEKNIIDAIEAGASGYILKDALTSSVASEIDTLLSGGSALSPRVAKLLLTRFRALDAAQRPAGAPNVPAAARLDIVQLSPRETDVLQLIARGLTYSEVGNALNISSETVSAHLRNIYKKLEVHSKSEAVFEANRLGILKLN